jgi:hypothetical protein
MASGVFIISAILYLKCASAQTATEELSNMRQLRVCGCSKNIKISSRSPSEVQNSDGLVFKGFNASLTTVVHPLELDSFLFVGCYFQRQDPYELRFFCFSSHPTGL